MNGVSESPIPTGRIDRIVTFDVDSALVDSRRGGTGYIEPVVATRGWPLSAATVFDCWDAHNKLGRSLTVNEQRTCFAPPVAKPKTRNSKQVYRQHRSMVERSIAWLARRNRKVRYRGAVKSDHWWHPRAAAINLKRMLTRVWPGSAAGWALVPA